jgi:hypothetical protein
MQEYVGFCTQQTFVPLHLQSWWLEALSTEGQWSVAISTDGEGVAGVWPWYQRRRWGVVSVVSNPPLSSYAGPWLRYPDHADFKQNSRYSYEKKHLTALAKQLPRGFFRQTLRPEVTNWMPLYWLGYQQTTRYTYLLDTRQPLQAIQLGLKSSLRGHITRLADTVQIGITSDTALIFRVHQQSLQRQKAVVPHRLEHLVRLHTALSERQHQRAWIATDPKSGEPMAVLYLIYDTLQAGVLLTGTNPAFKSSNAIYGLYWEAIQFCHEHRLVLDFEGSMLASVEHTFRAFGGVQVPYFFITKP